MRAAAIAAALLALAACSAATRSGSGSSEVISRAEIEETRAQTAYDVIRRLRPQFLRVRGRIDVTAGRTGPGMTEPVVYMDGVRLGGVATLRTIDATDISEIRYLDGSDATTRYGTGHVAGAIVIQMGAAESASPASAPPGTGRA